VAGEFKKLDEKLDAGMAAQIDVLKLITLLNSGDVGRYQTFYEVIKEAGPKKERYTPSALFLMAESVAGTWKMIARDGFTDVLVRKLVYDRRLWDTIENEDKHVHYASKHLRGFTEAFGLEATNLDEDDKDHASDLDIDEEVEAAGAGEEAGAVAVEVEEPAPLMFPGAGRERKGNSVTKPAAAGP
jgi:hypothetical protein